MTMNSNACDIHNSMSVLHAPAVRDLAPPGDLTSLQTFSFEFNDVEMQYDSYKGLQVRLRWAPHLLLLIPTDLFCSTMLPLGNCSSSTIGCCKSTTFPHSHTS